MFVSLKQRNCGVVDPQLLSNVAQVRFDCVDVDIDFFGNRCVAAEKRALLQHVPLAWGQIDPFGISSPATTAACFNHLLDTANSDWPAAPNSVRFAGDNANSLGEMKTSDQLR